MVAEATLEEALAAAQRRAEGLQASRAQLEADVRAQAGKLRDAAAAATAQGRRARAAQALPRERRERQRAGHRGSKRADGGCRMEALVEVGHIEGLA